MYIYRNLCFPYHIVCYLYECIKMPEMNILPFEKKAHSAVKFIYMSCSLIGVFLL